MIERVAVLTPFVLSLLLVGMTPWCTRDRADANAFVQAVPENERVLIHPPWRDDVVRALEGIAPATTALAPRSGDSLAGLVILKERGGVPLPRAIEARVVSREVHGPIEILRTASTGVDDAAARDLGERLQEARVTVREATGNIQCTWSPIQRRHICEGLPEWMYVASQELPVAGRLERCVWAHPRTNAVLAIEYPGAHLEDTLALSLAITDPAADNAGAALVKAQLFVDDKLASTLVRDPGKRGFVTTRAPVKSGKADVRIEITTPHDGQRHTCFRLVTEAK